MTRSRFLSSLMVGLSLCVLGNFSILPVEGFAAVSSYKLPVPEREMLPNGLEILWFLSDALPTIDLSLIVRTGFRDDLPGKSGTAELISVLLDRGVKGMSATEVARAIESLGGVRNVSVEDDHLSIAIHGLAGDASRFLDLLGKIALQPEIADLEFKREHQRLLDRWNHIEDSSEVLAALVYHRILARGTVYGRGSFYSAQEFKKVSRKDLADFHKAHFLPNKSSLVVVGRANRIEFKQQIEKVFGSWAGPAESRMASAPVKAAHTYSDQRLAFQGNPPIFIVDRPGATQAQIRLGFQAPPYQSPDQAALRVANALTGVYFNSRLNSLIRDKLGLTYGINSSLNYAKDYAEFSIVSSTKNENVGYLIQKTLDVLKGLKTDPIPAEEVDMAKNYILGGFPLTAATLSSVASRWLEGYLLGVGPNHLNEFEASIHAVTPQAVQNAIKKYFDLDRLTIVLAGDSKAIQSGLVKLKPFTIKQVRVQDLK